VDLEQRAFALRHLYVYPKLRLAYTFIPKNACTSMKQTLGAAEGWWAEGSGSIHEVSRRRLVPGLLRWSAADERIVIIRDPWDRLLSAYQHWFLVRDDAMRRHAMEAGLADVLPDGASATDTTFAQFLQFLARTPDRRLNVHWRPQSSFLVGDYTRWLRFECLAQDAAFLAERGYPLRRAAGHGTSSLRSDLGTGWGEKPARALRRTKRQRGVLPTRVNMYDEALESLVAERFAEDVEIFRRIRRPETR
jgi:hypothetical protein